MLIQSTDGFCTHSCQGPGPTLCWEACVCLQDPPCVPSPMPGGRVSSARSCEAARCDFGNTGLSSHLSAQERSGWFVLSGMLAGFLHSRRRVTIDKCRHRFGSSAGQTGHIRDLCTPQLCQECPTLRHERSGITCSSVKKTVFCTGWIPEEPALVASLCIWEISLQPARSPGAAARVPSASLVPVGP